MQAYGNKADTKAHILGVMADGNVFPRVQFPGHPADTWTIDYEERFGIPATIALVAERIYVCATDDYARRWGVRFFDAIRPGQDLTPAVVWVVDLALSAWNPHDPHALGEALLELLQRPDVPWTQA